MRKHRLSGPVSALCLLVAPLPAAAQARGALPDGAIADWIGPDDYPASALQALESGGVGFSLDIDAMGRVIGCQVKVSSGSDALDDATCALIKARGRFKPARDGLGRPVADVYHGRYRWKLPATVRVL